MASSFEKRSSRGKGNGVQVNVGRCIKKIVIPSSAKRDNSAFCLDASRSPGPFSIRSDCEQDRLRHFSENRGNQIQKTNLAGGCVLEGRGNR